MKTLTRTSTFALFLTGAVSLSAQTAAPAPKTTAPVHHAATAPTIAAHKPAGACATDVPAFSPKIPALPAGAPCFKTLYTITSTPAVKLENVSPMESPELSKTLGLEPSSFSLLYIDSKVGTGALAQPHQWYTVHYTGYLLDGTKFDSSVDRGTPFSFSPEQRKVIPGWFTGIDGMHIGGKRRLYIPFQLAYGANASGPIPARSPLVFDIELISQSSEPPAPPPAPAKPATPAPAAAPRPATPPADSAPAKPATPQP